MADITFVNESKVELVQFAGGDDMVALAAWVSNESERAGGWVDGIYRTRGKDPRLNEDGKVEGLIKYLYREKHMSPFEHGMFTFYVETPIFVTREYMRHRTVSYNEMSGRYTLLPGRFYLPPPERPLIQSGKIGKYTFGPGTDNQIGLVWSEFQAQAESQWASYERMLDAGVAREVARDVLGVNIMTRFYATMNPRNLMQFLTLRTAPNALYEIRAVADKMEKFFAQKMPITHGAYSESAS